MKMLELRLKKIFTINSNLKKNKSRMLIGINNKVDLKVKVFYNGPTSTEPIYKIIGMGEELI